MSAKLLRGGLVLMLLTIGRTGDSLEDEIQPTRKLTSTHKPQKQSVGLKKQTL